MKKLFIASSLLVGVIASAFPFRSSCNIVFSINDQWAATQTRSELAWTLRQLNFNACGEFANIVFYP